MIDELKPYPEYRASDVEPTEGVPSHWSTRRLDSLFVLRREAPLEADARVTGYLDGRVTLRTNVIGQKIKGVVKEAGWQRIYPGDFAISGMNAHLGGMGVSDSLGKCSPIYLVLIPKPGTNAHFVSHAVRQIAATGRLRSLVNTIRFNSADFKREDLRRISISLPPAEEQVAIVRFIKHADQRIRRYVQAKQKLIRLLEEQRQAVVNRVVTQGLRPDVPRRYSGNRFIGSLPTHWDQRALWTISAPRAERNEGGLPLLSVFLDRGVIRYEDGGGQVHPPSLDLSGYQVVRVGDFVLNNQQAWRGSVGASRYDGIISPAYIVLSLSPQLDPEYGNYLLRSPVIVDQFVVASKGVGDIQRQIYWPYLRKVQVPVPPLEEQRQIVAFVDRETRSLSSVADEARREVALLREYHARLIADVVTGKLDVREAAARLPDVLDEKPAQEPLDEDATSLDGDDADAEALDPELQEA